MHVSKYNTLGLVNVFSATGLELHLAMAWFSSSSTVSSTSLKLHLLTTKIWVVYVKEVAPDEDLHYQFNNIWQHSRYPQRNFKLAQM